MSHITINPETCTKCGACVLTCPMGIIDSQGPQAVPMPGPEKVENCFKCGHCEAVCPAAAVKVDNPEALAPQYPLDASPISPAQMGYHMRMRRSIRNFKKDPVERETLETLMDMVRYAPTAMNSQAVEWVILHDTSKVREAAGIIVECMRQQVAQDGPLSKRYPLGMFIGAYDNGVDTVLRNAPHLVLTHAAKGNLTGMVDGTIAMTYLEVAAPLLGMGGCWAGVAVIAAPYSPELKEALGIPKDHEITNAMMLGRPQLKYQRPAKRKPANILWK